MSDKKKNYISCCGDSITFGLGATSVKNSYPAVLQKLLGDSFCVSNFGTPGATVINDYEWNPERYSPYEKSPDFAKALESSPDVVILMLGMNDGNPTHHFNSENDGSISEHYLQLYKKTLESIIERFQALPASPCVYLLQTTAMKREAGETFSQKYVDDFTDNLIKIRKIQEEIAENKKIILIDTHTEMQELKYYSDGCHLSDKGYHKLAEIILKSTELI